MCKAAGPIIEVEDLCVARGRTTVLDGYSFGLRAGGVLAVLGSNGVGKTTLLNTLTRVLPPSRGQVRVHGQTGFVPQLFEVPFSYSVLDIALMGRARHIGLFGAPRPGDYRIVRQTFALLGIEALETRAFNTLSGGQRQLVMIAQALASECDLLVLDEPCAALDYRNQDVVLDLLARLQGDHGKTIVFSTHMPQHAIEIASDVLLMAGPKAYRMGPASEIMSETHLSDLYGLPIGRAEFNGTDRHTFAPLFRSTEPRHA